MSTQQTTDAELIELGRQVRIAWVNYCLAHGDTKPSHIAPWEELNDFDQGADIAIARHLKGRIAAQARAEGRREVLDVLRSGFVDRWQAAKHLQLWHTQRVWSEAIELIDLRLDTGAAADGGEEPHAQ